MRINEHDYFSGMERSKGQTTTDGYRQKLGKKRTYTAPTHQGRQRIPCRRSTPSKSTVLTKLEMIIRYKG